MQADGQIQHVHAIAEIAEAEGSPRRGPGHDIGVLQRGRIVQFDHAGQTGHPIGIRIPRQPIAHGQIRVHQGLVIENPKGAGACRQRIHIVDAIAVGGDVDLEEDLVKQPVIGCPQDTQIRTQERRLVADVILDTLARSGGVASRRGVDTQPDGGDRGIGLVHHSL